MNDEKITCAWCGDTSHVEWIHGRGQCSSCKVILDEDFRSNGQSFSKNVLDFRSNLTAIDIIDLNEHYKSVLKYFMIP